MTKVQVVVVEKTATAVVSHGMQGPPGRVDVPYTSRVDWVSTTQFYKGEAVPGAGESTAAWRIKRVTIADDDDTTTLWAGGTANFDKVWADRASLVYA